MIPGTRVSPAARPTTVGDVMQHSVVTVPPEMTVRELVQTLTDEGISGAPVVDSRARIVGVVSATDVMRLAAREAEIPAGHPSWDPVLSAEEADDDLDYPSAETHVAFSEPVEAALAETSFDRMTVREIMTPVAFSVRPEDALGDVVQLLVRGRIHRALVVRDGSLLGIVTPFDLLRHAYGG